jgi:hypothetical protein
MIALAAALFAGLTGMYADSIRRDQGHRASPTELRRRPSQPHLDRLPNFLGQFVVIGLIALAGRVVLRLRLAAPPV